MMMELRTRITITDLDTEGKWNLVTEIISTVDTLHEMSIIHGDIKLSNIQRAPDGSLRLCDFKGSQKPCTEPPELPTLNWMSPARLCNLHWPLCKKDDLYVLGITIWEVYVDRIPFSGLSERDWVEDSEGWKGELGWDFSTGCQSIGSGVSCSRESSWEIAIGQWGNNWMDVTCGWDVDADSN